MKHFLFLRLAKALPAAWGILSLIFLLSRALSTPTELEALRGGNLGTHAASPAQVRAAERLLRQRLGLDKPLFYVSPAPIPATQLVGWRWQWHGIHNQYHSWLSDLLRGDLGRSFRDNQPVAALLRRALAATLPLTAGAFVVILVAARWLVLWLARHRRARTSVLAGFQLVHSLPLFVVALALLLLFANPDLLAWFPAYGLPDADSEAGWGSRWLSTVWHLVLPLLSLVLVSLPGLAIQLDNALQQELQADYVLTARAKGLTQSRVHSHHALRNALLPAITYAADLLPALVAGAVVVELIFALPGMGRLLAEAAAARDFPVLLGGVLLIAAVRLLGQIVADWLYYRADPRIQLAA